MELMWVIAGVIAIYLLFAWYFQKPFRNPGDYTQKRLDPTDHPD